MPKDEHKQSEGNPEIKQKIRCLRNEQSQKRIKVTVSEATVIITNPEHYAIALKYDPNDVAAPICVAKGLNIIAQKCQILHIIFWLRLPDPFSEFVD